MTEIIFGSIIIALLVHHFLYVKEVNRQTKVYIKAIMAKDLRDFDTSEVMEKAVKEKPEEPEFVPVANVSDREFNELIKEEIGG